MFNKLRPAGNECYAKQTSGYLVREVSVQLTARLFNATIVAADGEVPVWDPSVRFFKVYRDGVLKGYLYIDPYARPGGELCNQG